MLCWNPRLISYCIAKTRLTSWCIHDMIMYSHRRPAWCCIAKTRHTSCSMSTDDLHDSVSQREDTHHHLSTHTAHHHVSTHTTCVMLYDKRRRTSYTHTHVFSCQYISTTETNIMSCLCNTSRRMSALLIHQNLSSIFFDIYKHRDVCKTSER